MLSLSTSALLMAIGVILHPKQPPKGWNSYDFGNGTDVYGTPDYPTLINLMNGMQEYILPHGYNYFCVDGGWYQNGSVNDMDEFGRPVPMASVYPSLKGSWKPVSDQVHQRGLKMGLWVTLGIPNEAIVRKVPIKGTSYTADEIAFGGKGHIFPACGWNPDVARINTSHPGGVAYYKSLVELWEEWELDYLTIDCVFGDNMAPEDLELFQKELNASSRGFIVSLSPGDSCTADKIEFAKTVSTMARVTTDFYANWHEFFPHFQYAADLAYLAGSDKGFYINMDKLPFGKMHGQAELPLRWKFWPPCQMSILTLHITVQSPLMFGGDIRNPATCDPNSKFACGVSDYTLGLLNNDFLLEAHLDIRNPVQHFRDNFTIVWIANSASYGSSSRYVSVFNIMCGLPRVADPPCLNGTIVSTLSFKTLGLPTASFFDVMDLTEKTPLGSFNSTFDATVEGLGAKIYRITPSVGVMPLGDKVDRSREPTQRWQEYEGVRQKWGPWK